MLPASINHCKGFGLPHHCFRLFQQMLKAYMVFILHYCLSLIKETRSDMVTFSIPVQMTSYDGRKYIASMGPFQHSTEREFALMVNRRAIDSCQDIEQLRPVAKNLLEGWSSMNTALQSMMLENIQLRQTIDRQNNDLQAAEALMNEASKSMESMHEIAYGKQSQRARWNLWPW